MDTLRDVTAFFQVEHIYDIALVQDWVAAAAGDPGMTLFNHKEGMPARIATEPPLDGPILISGGKVFFERLVGEPAEGSDSMTLTEFCSDGSGGLKDLPVNHHSLATRGNLYYLTGEGDLIRQDMESGACEIPRSPYGSYTHSDHRVRGIGRTPKGIVALSRYSGRSESLVDALPDDPRRPIARAAILKDSEWGELLSGPATASRKAYILCHKKNCLLSLHLHKPELKETVPAPEALCSKNGVLLAINDSGRVAAASDRGIDLLTGPDAPLSIPFPENRTYTPARLVMNEKFVLLSTREGRLFGIEFE